MKYLLLKPTECESNRIDSFYNLVIVGGQVSRQGLRERIVNAELLAFCEIENEIVGIASLKNPTASYKVKVFHQAGAKEQAVHFKYEIGYAVTKREYRKKGISKHLISLLINSHSEHNIFATTKVESMCHILENIGFKRIGNSYNNSQKETLILFGYKNNTI